MRFHAHGHCEIRVQGQVVITRLYQAWNLEGVNTFFETYKSLIRENALEKFGALSDLRGFEGGPPDVMAVFEEIAQWAKARGQIARAQISPSDLISHMIHQPSRDTSLFPIKTFDDEIRALIWLRDQGLDIG